MITSGSFCVLRKKTGSAVGVALEAAVTAQSLAVASPR
jgi:hypothetical protein